MSDDDLRMVVEAFIDTVRIAAKARLPATGMSVPYQGEFCSATPAVIRDLEWWARQFEQRLEK